MNKDSRSYDARLFELLMSQEQTEERTAAVQEQTSQRDILLRPNVG